MEATSPVTKQSVGRTFLISITLLGVLAAIQLAAVFWVFMTRYRANVDIDTLAAPLTLPVEGEGTRLSGEPPAETSPKALSRPTPVPASRPSTTTEARLIEMIQQARSLRERGDVATALTRLREAFAISPKSALISSELAITFEKMGQVDKALEHWRRIYEMGESAGIYYSAAEAKVRAVSVVRDATGLQPGSVLGLMDIEKEDLDDPDAAVKFVLRIPLRAKPNVPIDVRDAIIQVYFYDIINGEDIVQTNANVSSYWSTSPPDWSDDDIEVLEVEYTLPKPPEDTPPEQAREYYGNVVRVYYRNELQDMRAEPVSLLKKYPPPLTLQPGME